MPHSSDSDEFFDAIDITPTKGSKKSKTPQAQVQGSEDEDELQKAKAKNEEFVIPNQLRLIQDVAALEIVKDAVDITPEKNVVQGRRKFRELRQFMQTEDDDCGPSVNSTPDSQNSSAEGVFPVASKHAHPFRIVEHDTMSMQSLTSLGRIGRILGGIVDPSGVSVGRDSHLGSIPPTSLSAGGREPLESTPDEDQRSETSIVMPMQEPDVIASTKANSLKVSRSAGEPAVVAVSRLDGGPGAPPALPVAPPRRKKKGRAPTAQGLSSPDSDSILSGITGDNKPKTVDRPPPLQNLHVEPPTLNEILNPSGGGPLPSPATTIESLTREFQNSLEFGSHTDRLEKTTVSKGKDPFTVGGVVSARQNSGGSERRATGSETSSRSSTLRSAHSQLSGSSMRGHSLDIKSAIKGQYVVKPQDEDKSKAAGPSKEEYERMEKLKNELLGAGVQSSNPHSIMYTTNMGHSSLGASHRGVFRTDKHSKERRKSAGDEELFKQLNMFVRTRTDSGKQLTDMEILEQVTVLNLDTGERVPLSIAEDKLPQCINPLSLHIMRITAEYVSNSSIFDDDKQRESDEDTISVGGACGVSLGEGSGGAGSRVTVAGGTDDHPPGGLRKKTAKFKRFLGSTVKKTMDKAKSIAQEVTHARHKEDVADIVDEVRGEQNIKLKASNSHKGPYDFDGCVRHVQEFSGEHVGPVWCMKFSQCGRLLATAGQDKVLRIWVVRDAYTFFQDMRTKYNADQKCSPTPSQESLVSHNSVHSLADDTNNSTPQNDSPCTPFMPKPFCTYSGHTSDLLDVSWSKNYFVLSSSMDKTVRLWHISRKECLCCFQHIDFVTAIVFHPKDDRYFLSGSLDGKLRLWNIPDKKVAVWNELDGKTKLITAANFCQNGKFAVVGSYDGRCIFYTTDQLKYHTQIDVKSTRGKNSTGRKISGIEPMPGKDKILVTSNDSRIRLYDLTDLSLSCKYKGYVNVSSQIKASFSHDGKYIVSGSENQCIYIWKTHHDYSKFTSVRRDRNDFWEGIKAHNALVTCAVFAPNPDNIIRMMDEREQAAAGTPPKNADPNKVEDPMVEQHTKGCGGHVLVSADFSGCIKVFVNKTKPKHSSLPASALA